MIRTLGIFLVLSLAIACKKEVPVEPSASEEPAAEVEVTQKILLEPFVSVGCGDCPVADQRLRDFEADRSHVFHISHYIYGPLHHPYTDYLLERVNKTMFTPLAHIQRAHDDGSVVYYGIDRLAEITEGVERTLPDVAVAVTVSQNEAGKSSVMVCMAASESFQVMEDTDIQWYLTVMVVENSVTGEGPGYDQRNYGNDDPNHPYYQQGEYIAGYEHTHVIRQVLTAFEGDPITLDQQHMAEWTAEVDGSEWPDSEQGYSIVAFVSKPGHQVTPITNMDFTRLL